MSLFAFEEGAAEAAAKAGTPCFAYRLDIAERGFRRLRSALPARVRLAYAVKSNPHPGLVGRFASLGASLDCASGGELKLAAALRLPGSRILFAGPGKARSELEMALALGARIEVDGIEDIERIVSLLSERPSLLPREETLPISVRVHPAPEAAGGFSEASAIIGGTAPSAFGVDEEKLGDFIDAAAAFPRVAVRGLQVFASSNERSAERLLASHAAALSIARKLEGLTGAPVDLVDLGGGLGIPYAEGQAELDVEALGRGLESLLAEAPWFAGELLLEPGRWLSGPCGVYLARVIRVKESRGKRFAILEGGINHLLRPLLTGEPFPVAAVGKSGPLYPQVLAGPLCSSLDRLGEIELPELEAGDLLVFGQAGAYGFTEAMTHFLSHEPAAERLFERPPA
jgi:diaminopimelate decarboxylase